MPPDLIPEDLGLAPRALSLPARPWIATRRRTALAWCAALAGAVLVLLAPAVWNGFPFMFYDTGAYIDLAVEGEFRAERSIFYAAFLGAFQPQISLWTAVAVQVLMTVLVMAAFARALLPGISAVRFFIIAAVLSLGTALPWNAADMLPDIFAPILVLSLYLLGFHTRSLGWPSKVALTAVAVFAATAHASHLGLTAGLAVGVALAQFALRHRPAGAAAPRFGLPALVFGLALLSLVASNFLLTGQVFFSRSGPSFLLARLVQDGIAKRVLDDTCPASGYRLCAYKDDLPADSNDYLWNWQSPFLKLGTFEGMEAESKSIVIESLKRYPLLHLKMAVRDTLQQFAAFQTGDGIEPLNDVPVPALQRHLSDEVEGYRASRQQSGRIGFGWINAAQVPIGALAMLALAAILVCATIRRSWDDRAFLPAFLLLALIGNAFICGALSSPHDRYQSRLIWPACLAVMLLTARPSAPEHRA